MECLYTPELTEAIQSLVITGDEYTHAKALRLSIGEQLQLTNGKGITAVCNIIEITKKNLIVHIESIQLHTQPSRKVTVALGILDNRDRLEFAVEKAVELGVTDFIPLQTQFVQRRAHGIQRLECKAVAALKQSKQPFLLHIHPVQTLQEVLNSYSTTTKVLADEYGNTPSGIENDILFLVGPEGGFSDAEKKLILSQPNVQQWKLANSRLRAETAAISCMAINAVL